MLKSRRFNNWLPFYEDKKKKRFMIKCLKHYKAFERKKKCTLGGPINFWPLILTERIISIEFILVVHRSVRMYNENHEYFYHREAEGSTRNVSKLLWSEREAVFHISNVPGSKKKGGLKTMLIEEVQVLLTSLRTHKCSWQVCLKDRWNMNAIIMSVY